LVNGHKIKDHIVDTNEMVNIGSGAKQEIVDYKLSRYTCYVVLENSDTRTLKQAVKRNHERFPADFMFELNDVQINTMVSQIVIPSRSHFGGSKPLAFTEEGVAMPSSVLRSSIAIEMSLTIIRTFVELQKLRNYAPLP
jgi:hypothetical protein